MKKCPSVLIRMLSLCLVISIAFLFVACAPGSEDPSDPTDKDPITYTVMVSCGEGVSVTSTNPLKVNEGDDAQFDVSFENGYIYISRPTEPLTTVRRVNSRFRLFLRTPISTSMPRRSILIRPRPTASFISMRRTFPVLCLRVQK